MNVNKHEDTFWHKTVSAFRYLNKTILMPKLTLITAVLTQNIVLLKKINIEECFVFGCQ
jgi:hypothetical protein